MDKPSFQVIDYLPLYSRMLDEAGILEHFANALQPQYDAAIKRLDLREVYLDPNLCPEEWLDFVGQYVGLSNIGSTWLGIGLNPDWSGADKRNLIRRANAFFMAKGTDWAVREGVAIWLRWQHAHTSKLDIRLPFGGTVTAHPPQWSHYLTRYDAHLNQTYRERQHFGSGDYEQQYRPYFRVLTASPLQTLQPYNANWSNRVLIGEKSRIVKTSGSALTTQRPWMHFELTEEEWNNIFPDILELNPEIWNTYAEPEVFGWHHYTKRQPLLLAPPTDAGGYFRREEVLDYDGFEYYFPWHYSASQVYAYTVTDSETVSYQVHPGHSFGDSWNSQYTPTNPNQFYYVPYNTRTITTETVETVTAGCRPGFLGDAITGYEEQLVGASPAIPPNHDLLGIDGFDPTLDLSSISSINYSTEGLSIPIDGTIPLIPASELASLGIPEELTYQWVQPLTVHAFNQGWNQGFVYYSPGAPAQPGVLQQVPVIEQVRYCNVVDRYSMRVIRQSFRNVPVDQAEQNLFAAYPQLRVMSKGDNWKLLVETREQIYVLKPQTMFWSAEPDSAGEPGTRRQFISPTSEATNLYLEFLLQPNEDSALLSYTLTLDNQAIEGHTYQLPQTLSNACTLAIRYLIPLGFESGATSFEEDRELITNQL